MGKDPSKIKRCPECKRLVEAAAMRPVSRLPRGGVQFVCLECFTRGIEARKKAGDAIRK